MKENLTAKVAIKMSGGITRRVNIKNVIMQGTVWGSLMCTCTMDKLGKIAYENEDILYRYKGVPIPTLGMVDDIACVTTPKHALKWNAIINKFMELKKLELSEDKCKRLHIGKQHNECPNLKVHDEPMKDSVEEKYLGDKLTSEGNINKTIADRKA